MKPSRIVLAILFCCFSFSLFAENLILNGGFTSSLANWSNGNEQAMMTQWVPIDGNGLASGSAQLKWNGNTAANTPPAIGLMQPVVVAPDSSYTLSGRARANTNGNAAVLVLWRKADGSPITTSTGQIPVGGATFSSGMLRLQSPRDATSAVIMLAIPRVQNFTALFDDIVLDGPRGGSVPSVIGFTANPTSVRPGQVSVLSFAVANATTVTIDNGVGTQPLRGSVNVTPSVTTTYTLTATGTGGSTTARATVNVLTTPRIVPSKLPQGMLQAAGQAGATTSYTLTNLGGVATAITLSQQGDFFTQSPTSFTLPAGGSQVIAITAKAVPPGEYSGKSLFSGNSLPPGGAAVPIKLLSADRPQGQPMAKPDKNRIDIRSASGTNPTGSVTFSNPSSFPVMGVLTADVSWLVPSQTSVTIAPGQSATFGFTIDRAERDDGDNPTGSATGTLSLSFLNGGSSATAKETHQGSSSTLAGVIVVDTVTPTVSSSVVPVVADGEVGLVVAGVGHVTGSGGKEFISDMSIANPLPIPASDMKLYYTSSSASATNSQSLSASQSLALADVVTTVFGQDAQVGTIHLRSSSATTLSMNANVFNKSNPSGTYGTALPTMRTDRSSSTGETIVLSGLKKDATSHTNLYLQEMAGSTAMANINFMNSSGQVISTVSNQSVGTWALVSLNDSVPTGAVTAVVTPTSGKIAAFATPVDDASGDTWAVADWDKQFAISGSEAMLVPVIGIAPGANNTNFRSDLTVTNIGTEASTISMFYTGTGETKTMTLAPMETSSLDNVVSSFFGVSGVSVGALFVTPQNNGKFVVTSRTYTATTGSSATFGTGVPTVPLTMALQAGDTRTFGGIEDSTTATVTSKQGGTFRTNFGMVETSGKSVTVEVSVSFADGSQLAGGGANGTQTYSLSANQYVQYSGVVSTILGSARDSYGDLHNVQVKFNVVSGEGSVVPFITSTDNGTGDTVLRTE